MRDRYQYPITSGTFAHRNPLDFVPESWRLRRSILGVDVAISRNAPGGKSFRSPYGYFLILMTPQPDRYLRVNCKNWKKSSGTPGTIEAIPNHADYSAKWSTDKENFILGFDINWINNFVQRELGAGHVDLCAVSDGRHNRQAHDIAQLLREEWDSGLPGSRLYLESLMSGLMVSLCRPLTGTAGERMQSQQKGGLSLRADRLVREYVQENYRSSISISDLADIAGLSYSHFLRAFRQTHGAPPSKMLRIVRLEKAQNLLLKSRLSTKQVADLTGFSSISHLTSSMKKDLGFTPGDIRRLK